MKRKVTYGYMMLVLMGLTACGSSHPGSFDEDTSVNDGGSGNVPSETALLSGVSEIAFDADDNASVTAGDSGKNYLMALFSYDNDGMNYDYQISGGSSSSMLVKKAVAETTEDFHESLRNLEADLEGPLPTKPRFLRAATTGSARTFNVLNNISSGSSYNTVSATLRYSGEFMDAYIDTRDDSVLTDDELAALLAPFEAVIAKERNLFGHESDVNGDGKFAILFSHEVNALGASGGGIITGYFYGVDLYSSSSYPASNQMEVIYASIPDPSGSYGYPISKSFALSNILPSVFPHEFQHMISYNQHVFVNGGSAEVSFLNEGLSHLAEDMYSIDSNGYMAQTGIENPARVSYYLNAIDKTCFVCGSSLSQRGGSYLFLRYLYEQAEIGNLTAVSTGAELIGRLLDTDKTGLENILSSATDSTDMSAYKFLLGRFALAVYFSDTGMTDDSRYGFTGISLRGSQNDNRGTVLDGPKVLEADTVAVSGNVSSSGIAYVSLPASGSIPVSLVGGYDHGSGYMIETE